MSSWDIAASDDEWEQYNSSDPIPLRFAYLFSEIAGKKVLSLSCKCPRKGAVKNSATSAPQQENLLLPIQQQQSCTDNYASKDGKGQEKNKTFEAFDFDNEESERLSAKRKTPSAKRIKKEKVSSSMSNVLNDLLRNKFLDELEAAKNTVAETAS